MSPLPAALRQRLESFAAAADASAPAPDPALPTSDALDDVVMTPETPSFLRADGTVDLDVFSVPSLAATEAAPAPAPTLATQSPAPLSDDQLRQVQAVNPDLATHVFGLQSQVQGLVDQLAALRREQADAAQLRAKVTELEQANAALISARQQADVILDVPQVDGLSDEDRQMVQDPRLLRIIERVAAEKAAEIARSLAGQVQARMAQIETRMTQQAAQAQEAAQRSAEAGLRARIAARHPDVQNVFHDPAFAAFLQKRVPFSPTTFAQSLQASWTAGDADTISSIVDEFKRARAATAAPAAAAPVAVPASQIPAQPLAAPALPTPPAPAMLKHSVYRQASALFRNGQLDAAKFEEIRALYNRAEREGRIDYMQ